MEDGNPNNIETRINVSKRALIAQVIAEMEQYQTATFNLQLVDELGVILNAVPSHTETKEKELYALSLEREPRENKAI